MNQRTNDDGRNENDHREEPSADISTNSVQCCAPCQRVDHNRSTCNRVSAECIFSKSATLAKTVVNGKEVANLASLKTAAPYINASTFPDEIRELPLSFTDAYRTNESLNGLFSHVLELMKGDPGELQHSSAHGDDFENFLCSLYIPCLIF